MTNLSLPIMQNIWAVVPVKDMADAKQRLSPLLTPLERRQLSRVMLTDVLTTLTRTPMLSGVMLVSRDHTAAKIAESFGICVLNEAENLGPSHALEIAARHLRDIHADGMLAIPGDVPLITPADIEHILQIHNIAPAMTIVPSTEEDGTNCLLCSPPGLIHLRYGPNSFKLHLAEATMHGLVPNIVKLRNVGIDIDYPEDLRELLKFASHTQTAYWLENAGIRDRLVTREHMHSAHAGWL